MTIEMIRTSGHSAIMILPNLYEPDCAMESEALSPKNLKELRPFWMGLKDVFSQYPRFTCQHSPVQAHHDRDPCLALLHMSWRQY